MKYARARCSGVLGNKAEISSKVSFSCSYQDDRALAVFVAPNSSRQQNNNVFDDWSGNRESPPTKQLL